MLLIQKIKVLSIFISKPIEDTNTPPAGGYKYANPMIAMNSVEIHKNKGIVGDRWYDVSHFKLQDNNLVKFKNPRNISLIDAQNIKEIKKKFPNLEPIDLRRNILTENLNLNSLINRYFKINDVLLKGVEFCKGCKHIEEYTKCEGLIDVLLLNGGIRAEVIESGFVKINDTIKRVSNA